MFSEIIGGLKMKEFIKHFKKWNKWRKLNTNSNIHKLLVLFKLVNSPTFNCMIYNDSNNRRGKR
jgi:hypothetical protein